MDPVAEGLDEGRVSVHSNQSHGATSPQARRELNAPFPEFDSLETTAVAPQLGSSHADQLFPNPLLELPSPPRDVPVSAFAAGASQPLSQPLAYSSTAGTGLPNGHVSVQSYQTLLS